MWLTEPTAVQAFADAQETPDGAGWTLAPALKLGSNVHAVALHCSASAALGLE